MASVKRLIPEKGLFMRRLWKTRRRSLALRVSLVALAAGVLHASEPTTSSPSGPTSSTAASPLGFLPRSRRGRAQGRVVCAGRADARERAEWLRVLTAEPHVAGTPADYKTAVFVRDKLREWGWNGRSRGAGGSSQLPVGRPLRRSLAIERPIARKLSLDEAPVATDKDSASSAAFGAFNGYGVSGKASGQVVYVNYGRPEDYDAIEKMGIDVKGKIVLARYGSLFRGLKVRNAQKRGAAGILIFSDPADDGFAKGDVYPQRTISTRLGHSARKCSVPVAGARRSINAVWSVRQREQNGCRSIPCIGFPRGDEWEKTTGLKRDDYFATIPCLPISYDTAHEILKLWPGPMCPRAGKEGCRWPYHVGPGPAEVRLSVWMDYQIRKIWNVIATIPGTVEPDRWVMVGNHRDAWVYGAVDPGSGTAATMEMCRALGSAVKNGWKPRRTLLYASWDAEEYGLVGSTEWAEQNSSAINEKAVLLLNVDSAVSGPEFGAQRRAVVARAGTRRRRSDRRSPDRQVAPVGVD